ncbi:MAG: hypothetical protein L6371_05345 [Candidatus Atribacteria bacterium]|nr:hypothetical protein [Candidatus Atribacteria bacterium]
MLCKILSWSECRKSSTFATLGGRGLKGIDGAEEAGSGVLRRSKRMHEEISLWKNALSHNWDPDFAFFCPGR